MDEGDEIEDVVPQEQVYVIGSPNSSMVKIGRTIGLAKRFADIQRMSPVPLAVLWTHPGGHELETNLHRHFKSQRSHGEWFDFGETDAIQRIKEAVATTPWAGVRKKRSRRTLSTPVGRTPMAHVDGTTGCAACGDKGYLHERLGGVQGRHP